MIMQHLSINRLHSSDFGYVIGELLKYEEYVGATRFIFYRKEYILLKSIKFCFIESCLIGIFINFVVSMK